MGWWRTSRTRCAVAKRIGYPVMIKAVAGGGGRGMRVAHNDISLVKGYHTARTEAEKAFGNSGVYIEKFIENPAPHRVPDSGGQQGPHHSLGRTRLLHPAPQPEGRRRNALRRCSKPKFKRLAREDGQGGHQDCRSGPTTPTPAPSSSSWMNKGNFYFLEVNKRIQVEHPITEEVTGMDLVALPNHASPWASRCKLSAKRIRVQGPRHRMPHQCRRSLRRVSSQPGPHRDVLPARRPRRAGGQPCLCRLHHPARPTIR